MKFLKTFFYKRYLGNQVVMRKKDVLLRLKPYRKINMLCFDEDSIILPGIIYWRYPLHLFSIDYNRIIGIEENEKFVFLVLNNGFIHAIGKMGKYHWYVNVLKFTNPKKYMDNNYMVYANIFGKVFIDAVENLNKRKFK